MSDSGGRAEGITVKMVESGHKMARRNVEVGQRHGRSIYPDPKASWDKRSKLKTFKKLRRDVDYMGFCNAIEMCFNDTHQKDDFRCLQHQS